MAEVEPAPLVDELQEAPDVLDVRVREGRVVVAPVHPLAEADRAACQLADVVLDDGDALAGELRQAVLLDLGLGVQPERLLDADLDPQALAVEAVLEPLIEAAHRLVALEDVLERPPPRRVHAQLLVRGDRAVDEAPSRPAPDLVAQLPERALALPELEDLQLEGGMVRLVGEGLEHGFDSRAGKDDARSTVYLLVPPEIERNPCPKQSPKQRSTSRSSRTRRRSSSTSGPSGAGRATRSRPCSRRSSRSTTTSSSSR